jgi:alkylation response protein AidB-like acyl-CoA dehydrogenase
VLAHVEGFDVFAGPATSAVADGTGFRISGHKPIVRHADVATAFIVSARDPEGETGLYLIEAAAAGVKLTQFRQIDASGAAALDLDHVHATRILQGASAQEVLEDALEWGILGVAAESVGIVEVLNQKTFAYLLTRKQFGQPLAGFQALQHRAADMHIAACEAFVMVDALIEAFEAGHRTSAAVSAVKAVIDRAGRKVGHEAVQLHGAMGVSDELDVSHYMRRLAAIRAEFGTADLHRLRYRQVAA